MQGTPIRLMIAALVAYGLLRTLSVVFPELASSPLRSYGADILAPLVLIPLFAWLQVLWRLRSPHQPIGVREIVLYVASFSLIYELILPSFLPRLVSDPRDVVAYGLGGFVLWLALRLSRRPRHRLEVPS